MEWTGNIIVNTMDVVMIYFLFCGFTDRKLKIDLKTVAVIIALGVCAGTGAEFLRADVYQFVFSLCELLIVHYLYRKKIYNTVIVFGMSYLVILTVQLVTLPIILLLPVNETASAIIGQTLTICIVLFLCQKISLHRFLRVIESQVLLQLCVFLFSILWLSIVVYFNFSYEDLKVNLLFLLLMACISLVGLGKVIRDIFHYTNRLPIIHHETKNTLVAVYFSLFGADDIYVVREEVTTYLELLGMEMPVPAAETAEHAGKLLTFIEYKKQSYSGMKKIVLDTDIHYPKPHPKVPYAAITSMLAILLDNAMDAGKSGKPIKITLHSSDDSLILNVGNSFVKKESVDLTKIFEEGYSSKTEGAKLHGFGLSRLKAIADKYKGEVFVEGRYIEEEGCNYLYIGVVVQ